MSANIAEQDNKDGALILGRSSPNVKFALQLGLQCYKVSESYKMLETGLVEQAILLQPPFRRLFRASVNRQGPAKKPAAARLGCPTRTGVSTPSGSGAGRWRW